MSWSQLFSRGEVKFKRREDILEDVKKFCYLGDKVSCYGGASDAVDARIRSAWKFSELSGVLVGKQDLSLKGLRVHVDKRKGMQLLFAKKIIVSKVDPCGVCDEQVGCNSIEFTKFQRWVHRRCSDVPRQVSLLSYRDVFVCRTCHGHNCSVDYLLLLLSLFTVGTT